MKTNEYKFFISDCKIAIEKIKSIDISYSIEDISLRNFKSYNNAKKQTSNLRQKNINHIDELLVLFDKKFIENGLETNWAIDYNSLIEDILKIFSEHKIKEVNIFESRFIKELGIIKKLKEEDFNINPQSLKCVIFEPKYAIAQTGSVFLDFESALEMELVMEAEFKIFILPFNNILKNIDDIELLSQLYSINKNKADYLSLTTIYTPKINKETNLELFIVDNGRTSLLELKEHRKALTCIDCDACKKVCPVYALIGEEPYNNVFTGPIANVVLPFLETADGCKHLSFNCVLCGNCDKVCPMNIPITDLIIANRNIFFENRNMDFSDRYKVKILKDHLVNRKKINKKAWMKEILLKFLIKRNISISRPFPKFAKETFSQIKSNK
ncbi:MAG: 4Fe-4S dicluster domain-containing protein [Bacteroidales bacterium]|nr:4Fe-4S dicluster domain-containing protein [Bacteroidales bacterium]